MVSIYFIFRIVIGRFASSKPGFAVHSLLPVHTHLPLSPRKLSLGLQKCSLNPSILSFSPLSQAPPPHQQSATAGVARSLSAQQHQTSSTQ